jgi:hypothetical protein
LQIAIPLLQIADHSNLHYEDLHGLRSSIIIVIVVSTIIIVTIIVSTVIKVINVIMIVMQM